ncbi:MULTISPECIES: hypothetical protein [unclassified Psychrobacter]|uniref:hypothetical protein n=1 Tax=unclassified Psychrobacter TaxID=196806 RepID=UPI0025B46DAC|nr:MULTISPECIES: hypothetical protein [unclassified Psychrobacter]MDN3453609.1 hypothetical protein [Psychrobacter sp. APC 3350]MDN3501478.1 hypothetical protein [Psychrobacter sp. 5A.1]
MESLLSIFGSVASIGAAVWAFLEANKAAASASKSEEIRNGMIDRRRLGEVSKVHAQTDRILSVVSKIGPSCNTKKLKGVDYHSIAKDVEEYARFINEQSSNFSHDFVNRASSLYDDLEKDIEELSEASSPEIIKNVGKRIYYKINSFMPFVKDLADEQREYPVSAK